MTPEELALIVTEINQEVQGILRARAALQGIYDQLATNEETPFEQDYVYAAHYGAKPSQARTKVVSGITITTRILHQIGKRLSDIAGADLLYEIPGRKYVLIQYKRSDSSGRVLSDAEQLDELVANCPVGCDFTIRSKLRCGSWYGVIDNGEVYHSSACKAREVFAEERSVNAYEFKSGLTQRTFDEMFGKCYIGARLAYADVIGQAERALSSDRLLFSVVERD